jgi:hypothetical protein
MKLSAALFPRQAPLLDSCRYSLPKGLRFVRYHVSTKEAA